MTGEQREALVSVARDIGTVAEVAQRPQQHDRQMVARLEEWRRRIFAALDATPERCVWVPQFGGSRWLVPILKQSPMKPLI
jgi:hypothetical protein